MSLTPYEKNQLQALIKSARECALHAEMLLTYGQERIDRIGGAGCFDLVRDMGKHFDALGDAALKAFKRGTT